jgi:hypothetical protein
MEAKNRWAMWPSVTTTRDTPTDANWRRITSMIGMSPTGKSGLGIVMVKGFSRVPFPPARMMAIIVMALHNNLQKSAIYAAFSKVRFLTLGQCPTANTCRSSFLITDLAGIVF